MTDEIQRVEKAEIAWSGKRVRSTREQVMLALGPIFAAFPNAKVTDELLNVYAMMLQDIKPEILSRAVVAALDVCEFFPTIAAIRARVDAMKEMPGPRSDVDPRDLKPVPTKMFRLDPEEDRRQRMAQLRRTEKWEKYY